MIPTFLGYVDNPDMLAIYLLVEDSRNEHIFGAYNDAKTSIVEYSKQNSPRSQQRT